MVVARGGVGEDYWAVVVILPAAACDRPTDLLVVVDAGELLIGVEGDVDVRDVGVEFFPVVVCDALIIFKEEPDELVGFGRPDTFPVPVGEDCVWAVVGDLFEVPVGVFSFER